MGWVIAEADVERLLSSPLFSPRVSVSGHVYDIATGHLTTIVDPGTHDARDKIAS